jgi:hypothetical protein
MKDDKDDYAQLSPKQREILENSPWVAARRELVEMGLLRDSGRRRDGMIVWELTPLGKEVSRRSARASTRSSTAMRSRN